MDMAQIRTEIKSLSMKTKSHHHPYGQYVISLKGSMLIECLGRDLLVDESNFVYVPSGLSHTFRSLEDNEMLVINVPTSMVPKRDAHLMDEFSIIPMDDKLTLVLKLILMEREDLPDSSSLEYLYMFMYDVLRRTKSSKSIEYITSHFDQEILVSDLAAMEHYSDNYYRAWFKRQTGMTPKEYIVKLRVEKAKILLVTTKYEISKIASQVGYSQNSSFTRVFKEAAGCSPLAYRKANS
jgi:AraC-like DNA-binding protein